MQQPRRWVVFDLGETLVDETRNWSRWADHLGVPRLTFFALFGAVLAARRPHTEVFERFGTTLEQERAASGPAWELDETDLYPDALPVLAALRARGHGLAVMANQPLEAAPFLATLPVDVTATSAGWALAKPDPRFFARVCTEVGAAPSDIAYVGDRVDNDVLPALAAGMTAVHLRRGPWGHLHADWPEAERATVRLDDLTGLPAALDRVWR